MWCGRCDEMRQVWCCVLLGAICRVDPRYAALLCCCVTNAYIVCQICMCVVYVHYVCSVCTCSVCLHAWGSFLGAVLRVHMVLQVRRFVSRVAFGDHRAHDNVPVALFSPFVACTLDSEIF